MRDKLDVPFIKTNSKGRLGEYDASLIDLKELIPVDKKTLSCLPDDYQHVSGDDYLYFYDYRELPEYDFMTLIRGTQFGDRLNIILLSKVDAKIIADTSIVLSGAEDTWEGRGKGAWNKDKFEFLVVDQTDSVGYSSTEYTRRVDSLMFSLKPTKYRFEYRELFRSHHEHVKQDKDE